MPENHGCEPWPCEDCLLDEFTCRKCGSTYKMKHAPKVSFGYRPVAFLTELCSDCCVEFPND